MEGETTGTQRKDVPAHPPSFLSFSHPPHRRSCLIRTPGYCTLLSSASCLLRYVPAFWLPPTMTILSAWAHSYPSYSFQLVTMLAYSPLANYKFIRLNTTVPISGRQKTYKTPWLWRHLFRRNRLIHPQ